MNGQNVFAGAYVDRHGHKRADPEWLRASVASDESWFVPVWGTRCLARGEPVRSVLLRREDVTQFIDDEEIIFLGMYRDCPAFAIGIDRSVPEPFADLGQFHDLRYLGSVLPEDEANLSAHARALVIWHRQQKYCGRCGAPTRADSGGNTRKCTADECGTTIFPRVDPAIIVLVSRGDRCLLGRQKDWPEGRYSTVAGFVEPGESLEDAVAREVFEETNIKVGNIRYHSSQPWPFPSSLMLGFFADARSEEIKLNDGELEDARWFSHKEMTSGFPKLPYRVSIARKLVDTWISASDSHGD
jgi:NAD+ diphosphatase